MDEAVPGPVLFARYAFPPNSHGYCGPNDHAALFEFGVSGSDDVELRTMARQFDGAWPYLQMIARAAGAADPLDPRVVEAYWVGSPLLDRVSAGPVGSPREQQLRLLGGPTLAKLSGDLLSQAVPHHSFVVFCIYPWTGLLSNDRGAEHALTVLDQCRIRWGQVLAVEGDQVVVRSQPLTWDGQRLDLGPPMTETVVRSADGVGMVADVIVGDWVALHWEWVCDRLTDDQVDHLRQYTTRHLRLVNDGDLHAGRASLTG